MAWRSMLTVINNLRPCCAERSCLRNFMDIPDRVVTLPWDILYVEDDSQCCYLPKKKNVDFDFFV